MAQIVTVAEPNQDHSPIVPPKQDFTALLSAHEVLTPDSPEFEKESQTWSIGKNLHPKLVVRPESVESLSRAVKYLAKSCLNFNFRNSGAGDATASDVLISTTAFKDFDFDRKNEVVTIGAGCLWSDYHEKMKAADPDYQVVCAATPFIGVTGSILAAGFSVMSKEYGCISDPENLLDAEVVKLDGSVVWASTEPDLLWGLRGAHLGLGVVTKLKLRARKYPREIWGGPIMIPRTHEKEIAKAIAAMDKSEAVVHRVFGLVLLMPQVVVVNAFDSMGEAHGREAFAPLLQIEGVTDNTHITDMEGYAQMQGIAEANKGKKHAWWNPLALGLLTEDFILKTFDWQAQKAVAGLDANVMFELWGVRPSIDGPAGSAWPRRPECRHFCMLSMGAAPDASSEDKARAYEAIQEGPKELLGDTFDGSLTATSALDVYHDLKKIYGDNWERVVRVKKAYDPQLKLTGSPLARVCADYIERELPAFLQNRSTD